MNTFDNISRTKHEQSIKGKKHGLFFLSKSIRMFYLRISNYFSEALNTKNNVNKIIRD